LGAAVKDLSRIEIISDHTTLIKAALMTPQMTMGQSRESLEAQYMKISPLPKKIPLPQMALKIMLRYNATHCIY